MDDFSETLPVIRSMGDTIFDPVWALREHKSGDNEILYVVSGRMALEIFGGTKKAEAGDFLIVPSGATHRDDFDLEEGIEIFMVHFTWGDNERLLRDFDNDKLSGLSDADKNTVRREFDWLRSECRAPGRAEKLIARARLFTALLTILRLTEPGGGAPEPDSDYRERRQKLIATKAKKYMDRNYRGPLTLELVAENIGVSPFYLSRVFSSENNFPLFAYLNSVRMETAKKLLLEGSMNVSEVAAEVGFESGNYFSKAFKKYFGKSPGDFIASRELK
jgi:AraC-like DNA-binding protein